MSNYTIEVTENVVNLDVLKDHDIIIEIKSSDNFITFDTPSGYPILFTSGILPVSRVGSGYLIENLTSGNTIVRTFDDQAISGSKIFTGDIISSGNSSFKFQPTLLTPSYFPVLVSDPSTFSRNIYTRTSSQIKSDLALNNVQNIALSGVIFSAGSGLAGGGNLSSSRSFDVGQGDGLIVSADSIAVDSSTVVRSTNLDQSISGIKTFSSNSGVRFTASSGDGIYNNKKDILIKGNIGSLFNNTVTITPTTNLYTNRTYYLPETGADADFVMTAGGQVITGPKTFTSSLIFNSGTFQSLRVGANDVSVSGHTHTSSNITDFNTSVSGLLPITLLTAGSGIGISGIGSNYTISTTGTFGLTQTQVDSRVNTLTNGVYAPLSSPTFTGTPLTPTASAGTNNTQIASTAFVRTEISNLVASAPTALDTLNELAAALGNDANFATTVNTNIGTKASLSGAIFTGSISGPSGNFTSLKVNNVDVSANGHTHTSSNITDFNTSVDSRITNANLQPSGNYSIVGHTHTSLNITNFNSSVSGLLPVGTANYLSKFGTNGSGLSNSLVYDNGTSVGIGTATPSGQLHVIGTGIFSSGIGVGTNSPLDLIHVSGSSVNPQGIRLENADGYGGSILADNGALYFNSPTATAFRIQASKIRLGNGVSATAIELSNNGSISQDGNGGGLTFSGTTAQFSNGINVTNSGIFGSVGIGTTSPSGQLHVIGTGIFSSGVGIGTTTPTYDLDVRTNSTNAFYVTQGGGARYLSFGPTGFINNTTLAVSKTGWSNFASLEVNTVTPGRRGLLIEQVSSQTANAIETRDIASNVLSYINSSGGAYFANNVGIGTTNPQYKLDVNGNVNVSGVLSVSGVPLGEIIDDEVAGLLIAGSGMSLTYNDSANTLTIDSNATTSLSGGNGVSLDYNSSSDTLVVNTVNFIHPFLLAGM